ncbi:hypothetical protein [Psychroserpens ponticola]|uniref:DUF4157 domain-containing protein n=1 Tax=Psychroserpens ponticola TaxID=2932268 RepID=A0ABY7RYH3_9FLAO|nr:hypothetical protein [Psychroserpens ponticola]WCO02201.1 hypothetical protein MUN68_001630 [Psychroserpens ponticola]
MILISKYLVPKGYVGIAIFPFVFLRYRHLKMNTTLMNHEKIHLRQQLELFVLPFYFFYAFEFLIRLLAYRSWNTAYQNISFEREAYANEKDLNYLQSRSFWNFINYIKI